MKTKVIYIITKPGIGGAQKYVSDLMNNLDKNRFEAKILFGNKDLKWLSNEVWPWAFFLNDWLAVLELVKMLKKEQPNIVHLNSSKAGVIGSLAISIYKALHPKPSTLNLKVIFTAHGWVFNPTNDLVFLVRWFYILLHRFTALFQDKIICVSEYDYRLALHYGIAPKEKLVTIHNGINPDIEFLDKGEAREALIKKINLRPATCDLRPDWPWIGSVGRLVKEKNYETFIRAAALMTERQSMFVIIGEGPELEKLQLTIDNLQLTNKFFIIPPTGEDYKYLKALDIFIMSSIKEGMPYILLEAMAASLPAVVTETGGIPEMIRGHKNGLMVSQKDPRQLAQTIQGLMANKSIAGEISRVAKVSAIQTFSLQKMISKTATIYKENL